MSYTLLERLDKLTVATCNCGVKSPELEYHDDLCHYRSHSEAAARIRELETRQKENDAAFDEGLRAAKKAIRDYRALVKTRGWIVDIDTALTHIRDNITLLESSDNPQLKLLSLIEGIDRTCDTEYDGRMYTRCTSCGVDVDESVHSKDCSWWAIDSIIKKTS